MHFLWCLSSTFVLVVQIIVVMIFFVVVVLKTWHVFFQKIKKNWRFLLHQNFWLRMMIISVFYLCIKSLTKPFNTQKFILEKKNKYISFFITMVFKEVTQKETEGLAVSFYTQSDIKRTYYIPIVIFSFYIYLKKKVLTYNYNTICVL